MHKGGTGGTVHVQDEFYELRWSAIAYAGKAAKIHVGTKRAVLPVATSQRWAFRESPTGAARHQ